MERDGRLRAGEFFPVFPIAPLKFGTTAALNVDASGQFAREVVKESNLANPWRSRSRQTSGDAAKTPKSGDFGYKRFTSPGSLRVSRRVE